MNSRYTEILKIVREAGKIILKASEETKNVQEKSSRHDLVTQYDAQVQHFLQENLLSLFPQAGFLGEEEDADQGAENEWRFIVDPIDGTMNFIRDMRRSCVSVALAHNGTVEFGAVYDPYHDEMFHAVRKEGAFRNDQPIHVSNETMEHALVCVGTAPYYEECIPMTFALAQRLTQICVDIRRSGSAALELCDVACGRAELFYECRLCPWDYAAASLILTEAGGLITTMERKPLSLVEKSSVAAANPNCYEPLLMQIEEARRQTAQK